MVRAGSERSAAVVVYTNHTLKHKPMKQKEMYASPETEVMEFKLESVIAASPDMTVYDPFTSNPEEEW